MSESFELSTEALEHLGQQGFLSTWREQEWATLLGYMDHQQLQAGEFLFHKGEPGRTMHIIVEGALEVVMPGPGNADAEPLATLAAGSIIGEQAFFDAGPRTASVRAQSQTGLMGLTTQAFAQFAARHPVLATEFLQEAARLISLKLRGTMRRITAHLSERTAAQVHASAEEIGRYGVSLDLLDQRLTELRRRRWQGDG